MKFLSYFLVFCCGFSLCLYFELCDIVEYKRSAIDAGVAEYIVNSKTGEVSFVYKKQKVLFDETGTVIPIPSFENEPNFKRFD